MKAVEILKSIEEMDNKERIKLLEALSEKYFSKKLAAEEIASLVHEAMERAEPGVRISRKGEVWYAYNKQGQLKPYVILNNYEVNVAEIGESQEGRSQAEVVIEQWEKAGLSRPSVVRCTKIHTIHEKMLGFKAGVLSDSEFESVIKKIQVYIT